MHPAAGVIQAAEAGPSNAAAAAAQQAARHTVVPTLGSFKAVADIWEWFDGGSVDEGPSPRQRDAKDISWRTGGQNRSNWSDLQKAAVEQRAVQMTAAQQKPVSHQQAAAALDAEFAAYTGKLTFYAGKLTFYRWVRDHNCSV